MAVNLRLPITCSPQCLIDIFGGDLIILFDVHLLEGETSVKLFIAGQLALQELDLTHTSGTRFSNMITKASRRPSNVSMATYLSKFITIIPATNYKETQPVTPTLSRWFFLDDLALIWVGSTAIIFFIKICSWPADSSQEWSPPPRRKSSVPDSLRTRSRSCAKPSTCLTPKPLVRSTPANSSPPCRVWALRARTPPSSTWSPT